MTRQELEIPIVVGAAASWLALCLAVIGWLPLPVFILIAVGAGVAGEQPRTCGVRLHESV